MKTSTTSFYKLDPYAESHLFSVNSGIPLVEALEQASVFLSVAQLNEGEHQYYLIDLAKAIIDSLIKSGKIN